MNSMVFQTALWIGAGVILFLLIGRRRKRKAAR